MGFYGKISSSNKTAFSFDKTYRSRTEMDQNSSFDNIFIGRYVLVEYDEPPVTGYYNGTDFYNASSFYPQTKIEPRVGVVYQDLLRHNSIYSFYVWDGNAYVPSTAQTGYAAAFNQDVEKYGRGYDSTAWMKTFDIEKNTYRYVLMAELNTVVPNFHLVFDAPSNKPTAPYFDRDSTNVDYYLHAQAEWGQGIRLFSKTVDADGNEVSDRINAPALNAQSDEQIKYVTTQWHTDYNGNQYYDRITSNRGPADIYYNKVGFQKGNHTMADPSIENTINYSYEKSERLYGGGLNDTASAWNRGQREIDMMEWYIHLPAIGNAICELWDDLYSYNENSEDKYRYVKLATSRSDPDSEVTYNKDCAIGAINKMRDMLGWVIELLPAGLTVGALTYDVTEANKLYYTLASSNVNPSEDKINKYYYFTYYPEYIEATYDAQNNNYYYELSESERKVATKDQVYYRDRDGYYKHPNLTDWPAIMSDNTTIIGRPEYDTIYIARDQWKLVELNEISEDSLYGLIIKMHRLLGDRSPDIRDENSLVGCIRLIEDIIANISRHLAPYKMLVTNERGQIITSDTEYPYFNTMARTVPASVYADNSGNAVKYQEILNSKGEWRLPVWYRLYTLSLKNRSDDTKYFANGYFGNTALHELVETDTIGDAFLKLSEDVADAHYKKPEIVSFTAEADQGGEDYQGGVKVENGRSLAEITLSYVLNKGERQFLQIDRLNPAYEGVYTHAVLNNYHLDPNYDSSKANTITDAHAINGSEIHDTELTWRISFTDERSNVATKDVSIYYMNKIYWGVGNAFAANADYSTIAKFGILLDAIDSSLQTDVKTKFTVTAGNNKYIYFACPSTMVPRFEVCGIEGGFINLGSLNFTNGSGYETSYTFYRTVRPALGKSEVVVKEG